MPRQFGDMTSKQAKVVLADFARYLFEILDVKDLWNSKSRFGDPLGDEVQRHDRFLFGEEQRRGDWLSCYDARLALNPVTEYISLPNSRQTPDNDRICPARHTASGGSLSLLFTLVSLVHSFDSLLCCQNISVERVLNSILCAHAYTASNRLCKRIKTDTKQSFCYSFLLPFIFERIHVSDNYENNVYLD